MTFFVWFTGQHILRDLERRKIVVFTPSRRVAGKRVVCNDDWFIVKLAYESDGIIVSNDMYRDLQGKEPEWKRFIDERLLMYSFVNNKWVPPSWWGASLAASVLKRNADWWLTGQLAWSCEVLLLDQCLNVTLMQVHAPWWSSGPPWTDLGELPSEVSKDSKETAMPLRWES